jgi:membrane protease YdiL (CAAX protease family)
MSDPGLPGFEPPPELPPAQPPEPPPERFPFWGYRDLFHFIGLAVASLIAGMLVVKLFLILLRIHPRNDLIQLLPAQFLGYLLLFLCVRMMFRAQYDRPFWQSLGWTEPGTGAAGIIVYGVLLAFAVGIASVLLKTPPAPTPMSKLLEDRASVLAMAAFGVSLGPLCEELIFRGFLQPLFVRSLGAAPGILLAGILFGLLHSQEYGNSWQQVVLIAAAGTAFGWMRHTTGSTKASTIMHAAYNSTFFLLLLSQRKGLPHS